MRPDLKKFDFCIVIVIVFSNKRALSKRSFHDCIVHKKQILTLNLRSHNAFL